ncbi:MAG: GNAT family N-acetyltransferase [Acidobacteria bacterium]|nr:GNAT family N-acetyltransferase [Acidobacteriota bacterium]
MMVPPTELRDPRGCPQWPQWRLAVPTLVNRTTKLRELRQADASCLLTMISTDDVSRFISPPPTTLEGYQQFISWSHRRRGDGRYVCFGVVPASHETAVGIFQLQMLPLDAPEWGFAIGSSFWGTGVFVDAAEAVIDFAFRGMGLTQLGARATVDNGRGNGALRKIGAVCERVIPGGLITHRCPLDQYYWTVSADGRPHRKVIWI